MSKSPGAARDATITARNKHNALARYRSSGDPAVQAAKRDLTAARAEAYVRAIVEIAPPLTAEQRDRLAVLLRGAA